MQPLIRVSAWLAAFTALAMGCDGSGAAPATPLPGATQTAKPPAPPAPPPPPAPPVVAKPDEQGIVRITANDQMRYSATRIEVPVGQKIKIELKNVGVLPKEAMGHNLTVLKPGTDAMAFAIKGVAAKATDYIAPEVADQVVARTGVLGPGESQVLEFELPAGTYPYLCTFPGHVGLMNGQLVVQ